MNSHRVAWAWVGAVVGVERIFEGRAVSWFEGRQGIVCDCGDESKIAILLGK